MQAFEVRELLKERSHRHQRYLEFLRVDTLSAGVYVLSAGSEDPQKPHAEDEVYYVLGGRATVRVGEEDRSVGPGSLVFVKAGVEHRFHDIDEELSVLVFFAPPESSGAPSGRSSSPSARD